METVLILVAVMGAIAAYVGTPVLVAQIRDARYEDDEATPQLNRGWEWQTTSEQR